MFFFSLRFFLLVFFVRYNYWFRNRTRMLSCMWVWESKEKNTESSMNSETRNNIQHTEHRILTNLSILFYFFPSFTCCVQIGTIIYTVISIRIACGRMVKLVTRISSFEASHAKQFDVIASHNSDINTKYLIIQIIHSFFFFRSLHLELNITVEVNVKPRRIYRVSFSQIFEQLSQHLLVLTLLHSSHLISQQQQPKKEWREYRFGLIISQNETHQPQWSRLLVGSIRCAQLLREYCFTCVSTGFCVCLVSCCCCYGLVLNTWCRWTFLDRY